MARPCVVLSCDRVRLVLSSWEHLEHTVVRQEAGPLKAADSLLDTQ